jgi:hypothetical protein
MNRLELDALYKELNLPPVESVLDRWKREGAVFEAAVERDQRERRQRERASDQTAADARLSIMIQAAILTERTLLLEVIGDEVGKSLAEVREETLSALRDEIRELKIECAKLGSEVAELRSVIAAERSGKVIDLPNWKRSAN